MFHEIQLLKCFNNRTCIELQASFFFKDILWWKTFAESFNSYAHCFDWRQSAIYANDFCQPKLLRDKVDAISCNAGHSYEAIISDTEAENINVVEIAAVLFALRRWSNWL